MLHHIELYVSNLEKSREFWTWFLERLGYDLYQSWDKGFSYKLGEAYIVFVQVEGKYEDIPYHRCGTGLNHLAFYASSKAHVDELRDMLVKREVPLLYSNRYPHAGGDGHYAVFFEDPDRIKVEIVAP